MSVCMYIEAHIMCMHPVSNIPQDSSYIATYHPSRRPSKQEEQDKWDTAGEARANS